MKKFIFLFIIFIPTLTYAQHVNCFPSEDCARSILTATWAEFPDLVSAKPTLEESSARAEELLRRYIWHLHLSGFRASRQRNPSGLISNDKVAIEWQATYNVVDIATDWDVAGKPMRMTWSIVPAPNPVVPEDPGISDTGNTPPPDGTNEDDLKRRVAELEGQVKVQQSEIDRVTGELHISQAELNRKTNDNVELQKTVNELNSKVSSAKCAVKPGWAESFGVRCVVFW